MASVNKVILIGNLGRDPEMRYTPSGAAVCTLNIATTESWNDGDQRQEKTEWHRVITWNKQAENCAKYLKKGRTVYVEGKLQTRSWDDKDGTKKYSTEVIAGIVQFLGGPAANAAEGAAAESTSYPSDHPGGDDQVFGGSPEHTGAY